MEIKQITTNEWYSVSLTPKEWEDFHSWRCFTDYGITMELDKSILLHRDTLWMMLCELHKTPTHKQDVSALIANLELLLYPAKENDEPTVNT